MSKRTTELLRLAKHINAIKERGHKPRPAYRFISLLELKRLQRW